MHDADKVGYWWLQPGSFMCEPGVAGKLDTAECVCRFNMTFILDNKL